MSYQALYRKYRPRSFSDIIGQEHIITILKNQIMSGHVTHAYLFCGTRGTGKTTTAKILARAVNCESPINGNPCERCPSCIASVSDNPDIIEMDAASNTGVDDMRALMDKAAFLPLQLKKKVYIIDETHMLSQSAFNSLLKTLEEPPEHVMFILATTEPQKVPATILSRCQRLDFRRISVNDIVKRTKAVLSDVGACIDEEGLLAIARAADGAMRDALSLADQCVSFCGDHVTGEMVLSVLGAVDDTKMFNLADALISSDAGTALRILQDIIYMGRDLSVFVHDLIVHLRALLMAEVCGNCAGMLDCTEETMSKYIEQAHRTSRERLMRCIDILMKAQNDMRWLTLPRVLVESAIVRICNPAEEADYTALIDRVNELESGLASGAIVQTVASTQPIESSVHSEAAISNSGEDVQKSASPRKRITVTAIHSELINNFVEELHSTAKTLWALLESRDQAFVCNKSLVFSLRDKGQVEFLCQAKNMDRLNGIIKTLEPDMNVVVVHTSQTDDFAELERFCGGFLKIED